MCIDENVVDLFERGYTFRMAFTRVLPWDLEGGSPNILEVFYMLSTMVGLLRDEGIIRKYLPPAKR